MINSIMPQKPAALPPEPQSRGPRLPRILTFHCPRDVFAKFLGFVVHENACVMDLCHAAGSPRPPGWENLILELALRGCYWPVRLSRKEGRLHWSEIQRHFRAVSLRCPGRPLILLCGCQEPGCLRVQMTPSLHADGYDVQELTLIAGHVWKPGAKSLPAQVAEQATEVAAMPDSDAILRATLTRLQKWRDAKTVQAYRPQTLPTGNVLFVRRKKGRIWHFSHIPERLWSDVQGMVAKYNAATPAELESAYIEDFFGEFSGEARSHLNWLQVDCERYASIWDDGENIYSLIPPVPGTVCINCLEGTPYVGCPGPEYSY